ncbi:FAD binding domain-containing protein, partial [Rhodoplanes serenus]
AVPMLAGVAAHVAYRAVRNRGTVGGSLCHADPAADWPTALAALGADVIMSDGVSGRTVPVAHLITSAFETALAPGEILVRIRVPLPSRDARWS